MKSVSSARDLPVQVENHRSLEKWRKRNLYYYRDLEKLYQFLVQSRSRVLDVGSGSGYLLNAVDAAEGLGIDVNAVAVAEARQTFPNLEFQVRNAEDFQGAPHLIMCCLLIR
ncbi:MAG: class I SAM-dependent methyltransferase [Leptolyngbyaceae cyanobacterium CAN_BIN12]|nr:class I SAM-dependent methyltransferase [Leptolyngbyaceae cyanobacterium CAN_BIN12]